MFQNCFVFIIKMDKGLVIRHHIIYIVDQRTGVARANLCATHSIWTELHFNPEQTTYYTMWGYIFWYVSIGSVMELNHIVISGCTRTVCDIGCRLRDYFTVCVSMPLVSFRICASTLAQSQDIIAVFPFTYFGGILKYCIRKAVGNLIQLPQNSWNAFAE